MTLFLMPRPHPVIRALFWLLEVRPRVEVTPVALVVSLGWSFHVSVPHGVITDVTAVPWTRLSIGAHGWRGRWLVNSTSGPLVRVTIAPAASGRVLGIPIRVRELTLSIADVDAFLTELR